MTLSRDGVRQLAALAELAVEEADLDRLTAQIDRIVEYVGQLSAVTATLDAGGFHPGPAEVRLRDDVVRSTALTHPPAEFAPDFREGFFVVPKLAGLGGR